MSPSHVHLAGALSLVVTAVTIAWAAPGGAVAAVAPSPHRAARVVDVVRLEGIVGPATARYVIRGLGEAMRRGAEAIVVVIDTPGGLLKSTDDITKAMLNSPLPVVAFVYPRGARAASAGVFVVYAANIAAMAPATHLGAAHPVGLGTGGGGDRTEMTKLTNDAVADIRGIAAHRGRNAVWAERAVRQSESITAQEALSLHVIDLIAASPRDLLTNIAERPPRRAPAPRRTQPR